MTAKTKLWNVLQQHTRYVILSESKDSSLVTVEIWDPVYNGTFVNIAREVGRELNQASDNVIRTFQ